MTEDKNKTAGSEKPVGEMTENIQEAARQETAPRRERSTRTILFQAYLIAAISVFALLAFAARTTAYWPIDVFITTNLQRDNAPWFNSLMRFISWFGYPPQSMLVVVILILFLAILGFYWEAIMSFFVAAGEGAINTAVKLIVHRPRPGANVVHVLQNASGYSFPSGHVMFYAAFFGFMLFLVYTLLRHSWIRAALLIIFGAMVVLVAPSRIYLGDHWASDVLAGYLLGSLTLVLAIWIYRWGKPRFFARQPVAQEEPVGDKQVIKTK